MDKKILGIIIGVVIVAAAGMIYFGYQKGFFSGVSGGGIDKNSVMGIMKEQGETVMSKSAYIDKCKTSEKDTQDMCYGLGALYYRDASFCKLMSDPEAKNNCNEENIEKYYSDLEKGISPFGGLVPGIGTIPGGGVIPGGEESVQPETTTGGQEKPKVSGKIVDEIYVEIMAHASNPQLKDPQSWAADMKALYERYGITEDDLAAFGQELEGDPQRAAELGLKYLQRAAELRAIGK